MEPNEVPQEVVDAYTKAWEAKRKEIGRGIADPGTKTRAGLAAAITVLEQMLMDLADKSPAGSDLHDRLVVEMKRNKELHG